MSAKHTPGPWTLDACEGGWMLLAEGRDITTEPFDADDADAALIAAAPEMLRLLAVARDCLEVSNYEGEDDEVLAAIASVIAKAKGEA
jgi:hypothetical protein